MLFHVEIIFTESSRYPILDEFYDGVFINDNSEIVFLYQTYIDEDGKKAVERVSIPLNIIDTLIIKPFYEDNR